MNRPSTVIAYINAAHFVDHYAMLIFPAALLVMGPALGLAYNELLPYATPGFIAFGAGSALTGWLGDCWSRRHMMLLFFWGIGLALILTGLASTPWQLGIALLLVGLFASIYHPVGSAMLVAHARKLGRDMGINGVFGNLGVASSALITGAVSQWLGWRAAFVMPGLLCLVIGLGFARQVAHEPLRSKSATSGAAPPLSPDLMWRVAAASILAVLAVSPTFNAITVAMPALLSERLAVLADQPAMLGLLAAGIYLFGALTQYTIGSLIDRYGLRPIFLGFCLLMGPALYAAAQAQGLWLVFTLIVIIMAIFGMVTVNDTMVGKYTADRWRARAYAARYLIGFSAAGASVALVALLHARGGFTLVLLCLAALSLLLVAGGLTFPRETAAPVTRAPDYSSP